MDFAPQIGIAFLLNSLSMRASRLIAVCFAVIAFHAVRAHVPLGTVVGTFPYAAAKILADPVRPRIYVADAKTNSVIVLDTDSLKVLASIPTGSSPADMAISEDNAKLYVANAGSSLTAVAVINLGSLSLQTTFALPGAAKAIAAGAGGRLYVAAVPTFLGGIPLRGGQTF